MINRDARKLSPEAQYEIRRQSVKLHKKGWKSPQIGSHLEVHPNTVRQWIKRFKKGGMKALAIQTRGPKSGVTLKITIEKQVIIRAKLVDKFPDQYKLPFALWSREAVAALILQETGLDLDHRLVGDYLKRWGFTPQKPIKRAYQRSEAKVKEWLEVEYPAIKAAAKADKAEIYWADEAGMKSHDHRGRGYAPKGKTPIRMHNPSYEKINMISSITNQGKLNWMCYKETFTYKVLHKFLRQLVKQSEGKKAYVILDNHRSHHSKVLKRWVRKYSHLIELKFLPSYSPDLNPDEYFNCDVKTQLAKRPERRQKGHWETSVKDTLNELSNQQERVQSYFKSKHIKYAA